MEPIIQQIIIGAAIVIYLVGAAILLGVYSAIREYIAGRRAESGRARESGTVQPDVARAVGGELDTRSARLLSRRKVPFTEVHFSSPKPTAVRIGENSRSFQAPGSEVFERVGDGATILRLDENEGSNRRPATVWLN